jgi:hypothetical protein
MSIKVEVCSPILPPREEIVDLYRPKLYSFGDERDGVQPEHVDIVVTWKGLEISQAREVRFWENAAKAALESYVEELLIASIDALWAESSGCLALRLAFTNVVPEVSLSNLEDMCNYVNEMGPQTLQAPLESLTKVMLQYHEVFGHQFNWLINSSDASCAIANFLRAFDFFDQEASDRCQFRFNMHASVVEVVDNASEEDLNALPDRILHVYAVLASQPHRLSFVSGANREWKPYYHEPELCRTVPIFPADVAITSVGWDGKSASITVQKHFPGFVRLERVYRVRTHVNCFFIAPFVGWNHLQRQPFLRFHCAFGPRYGSWNSSDTACDSGVHVGSSRANPFAKCPEPATINRNRQQKAHKIRSRHSEGDHHDMGWDISTPSVSDGNPPACMSSTNWSRITPKSQEEYAKKFALYEDSNSRASSSSSTREWPLVVTDLPQRDVTFSLPSLELRGGVEKHASTMTRIQPFGVSKKRARLEYEAETWRRRPTSPLPHRLSNDGAVYGLDRNNWKGKNVGEDALESDEYPLKRLNSVDVGLPTSNGESLPYCVSPTIISHHTSDHFSTTEHISKENPQRGKERLCGRIVGRKARNISTTP